MHNRGLLRLTSPLVLAVIVALATRSTALIVLAVLVFPPGATAQSGDKVATNKSTPQPNKLAAVHARKLDGFELSAQSGHTGTQTAGASRGTAPSIVLLAPNKGRAYTLNPLFQWTNPDGKINTFEFRLLEANGETVLYKAEVPGTSFKYPSDAARALKAGGDYFWTVGPLLSEQGDAADPAELMVAGGQERSDLSKGIERTPEGSPARAELLVEKRLWYDAIEVYSKLIAEHPGDRQILLDRAELYAQLPQTQHAAEQDRKKAEAAAQ